MLFSSIFFLFIFLPVLILGYYLINPNYRNYLLLFASLFFYSWGGISYTILLLGSIGINFLIVKQIEKKNHSKAWLRLGLVINLVIIGFFKYLDFFISNINFIGHSTGADYMDLPLQQIVLPLGISFFTFQQMSLLWDVYRDEKKPNTTLSGVALYISLFPQLIAGPIVRYDDIIDQINFRKESIELFSSGVKRFIVGLFKKIIIANTFAQVADSIMDMAADDISTSVAWLGVISYAIQIYFDFAGYSDMAIGIGRMFGFRILENFNYPYISTTIQEFWRRWHISLSTWFRDYLYIPLGGNRGGKLLTYRNLIIVFLLTGFWHGATWSFVLWGIFHGFFLMLERAGFSKILNRLPKVLSWSYTILVVLIAWVFFRIEHIHDALSYVKRMFIPNSYTNSIYLDYLNRERLIILVLAFLLGTPIVPYLKRKLMMENDALSLFYRGGKEITLIAMFILSVIYINAGSYNPFIYFRF